MRTITGLIMLLALAPALMADGVSVTIYNSNLGVVSELRSLTFKKGIDRLAFTDVPSQIDPASVRFELTGSRGNISILEQNYAYDLVNPAQMYSRYVDEAIELVDREGKLYSGTLLSFSSGAVILEEKSGRIKIVQLEHIMEVSFPALPEGLITRPTLFWIYDSDFEGALDGRVGYQTTGMNWSAEYVGVLDSDEKHLDLSGWASIDNASGKTFKEATLKLVAGDIHRVTPRRRVGRGMEMATVDMEKGYAGFEEKAFFEYHLYTLPRKATLADKEQKQISLFEPAQTAVDKIYVYAPEKNPTKVEVAVKFKNSAEKGLGLPLPAGRVRLFKADTDASMIMLGEDEIEHTPRNEEVKLAVGYAFDIAAEEKVTSQERVSTRVEDKVFEISLSNRKEDPVTVEVEKKLFGFWDILESNVEFVKKNATTIVFKVPLKADETVAVSFKVRYYYR